jgi:hypothetical protein
MVQGVGPVGQGHQACCTGQAIMRIFQVLTRHPGIVTAGSISPRHQIFTYLVIHMMANNGFDQPVIFSRYATNSTVNWWSIRECLRGVVRLELRSMNDRVQPDVCRVLNLKRCFTNCLEYTIGANKSSTKSTVGLGCEIFKVKLFCAHHNHITNFEWMWTSVLISILCELGLCLEDIIMSNCREWVWCGDTRSNIRNYFLSKYNILSKCLDKGSSTWYWR